MALAAVWSPAQLASIAAGTGATVSRPASGLSGYHINNQTPVAITLTDGEGLFLDLITPWSVVTGSLIQPSDFVVLTVASAAPLQPLAGTPQANWQTYFELIQPDLPLQRTQQSISISGNTQNAASAGAIDNDQVLTIFPCQDTVSSTVPYRLVGSNFISTLSFVWQVTGSAASTPCLVMPSLVDSGKNFAIPFAVFPSLTPATGNGPLMSWYQAFNPALSVASLLASPEGEGGVPPWGLGIAVYLDGVITLNLVDAVALIL